MGTSTSVITYAGAVALAFFAYTLSQATKMREQGRDFASYVWYTLGLLPVYIVAMSWGRTGDQLMWVQRPLVMIIGGAIGVVVSLGIAELISPSKAQQRQVGNPPPPPISAPIIIPGSNNILNFGTAGDITQNSLARAQQAIRDPDGIYQLDQKVATVVAAEIDRSNSLAFFKQIQNAANLDINRDFQYREYILHFSEATDNVVIGGLAMPVNRAYANVRCHIIGIISQ